MLHTEQLIPRCNRLVCLGLPPASSPGRALHQLLKVVNMGTAHSEGLGSLAAGWKADTAGIISYNHGEMPIHSVTHLFLYQIHEIEWFA